METKAVPTFIEALLIHNQLRFTENNLNNIYFSLSYLYNEPKKENVSTFLFIINVNGKSKQKPDIVLKEF